MVFVVVTPFTNSNYFLFLHVIIIPFMMFHWVLNDNTCFLTLVEKYLRTQAGQNIKNEDCFTCRLIEPIYDFEKDNKTLSDIIYIITIFLWVLSFTKLYNKYTNGEISSIYDLGKI
jgi:hypothetical protein